MDNLWYERVGGLLALVGECEGERRSWAERLPEGFTMKRAADGSYYVLDATSGEYVHGGADDPCAAYWKAKAVIANGWPIDRGAGYPGAIPAGG